MADERVLMLEEAQAKAAEILEKITACVPAKFTNAKSKTIDVIARSHEMVFNEGEMIEVFRLKDLYNTFVAGTGTSEVRIPEEANKRPILFKKWEYVQFKIPYNSN